MALSDVKVRSAKARSKPYKITNGEGMFLLVAASGSKKSIGSKHIGFQEKKAGGTIPRLLRKEKTIMRLEKRGCWIISSGCHQARIVDARLMRKSVNGKEEMELRLMFEVTSLVHPTKKYLAKRVYRKGDSSEIIIDLEHLLGDDLNRVINLQGEIIGEALVLLVDQLADIEIEHHHGKNHDEPFCMVTQVTKAGLLIERMDEAA